MRRFLLLMLALVCSSATLLSPAPVKAAPGGGNCVTYCSAPNPCGYVCCFQQCCGNICVDLDCAPPPPCGEEN